MDMTGMQIFEASAREYDAWFDRHRLVYESEIQALKRFMAPAVRPGDRGGHRQVRRPAGN